MYYIKIICVISDKFLFSLFLNVLLDAFLIFSIYKELFSDKASVN